MPGRQYKAVAVGPDRIRRIEAQSFLPQVISHWRHAHWRTRMTGLHFLDRIDRERADCVDTQQVHLAAAHVGSLMRTDFAFAVCE
jgi:hypothetical protein